MYPVPHVKIYGLPLMLKTKRELNIYSDSSENSQTADSYCGERKKNLSPHQLTNFLVV